MSNRARSLLWPTTPGLVLRVAFLYVGQGSSAILLAKDGDDYRVLLHDINHDEQRGGINVAELMRDLLDGAPLNVFVNSHPHNDHLCGLDKLQEAVSLDAIWHSGHIPSEDHEEVYALLVDALADVDEAGGTVEELDSSRNCFMEFGEVEIFVIAPAEHVQEDIDAQDPAVKDARIHEYCAVLRVGIGDTWIILPGDADLVAWRDHITDYWTAQGQIQAAVLAASHHGSRSFFKATEADEPYLDALQAIDPSYVVISAPTTEDSPHNHPHEDAVALYADQVGEDNVLHTGANRYSIICDIYDDGQYQIVSDYGELVESYGLKGSDDDDGGSTGSKSRWAGASAVGGTRIDDRPMGER